MTRSLKALGAAAALIAAPLLAFPAVAEGDVVGTLERYRVVTADRFVDLAVQFHVGYVELLAANPGVNPWIPPPGTELLMPAQHVLPAAPREGIVINLAEMRLYYFPPSGEPIQSYAIGIGRDGWATPLGRTTVRGKRLNPTWTPPASIRAEQPNLPEVVPAGPDNPLGTHAVYLNWPSYVIHGTNIPAGVGRRVSHGCIRMYPEDIATLFPRIATGAPVMVVDQPVKVGWLGRDLYLEVHPTIAQHISVEYRQPPPRDPLPDLMELVRAAAGDAMAAIDVRRVYQTAKDRSGVPVRITVSDGDA